MLTTRKTWTRRRVGIIVGVAIFYGVWFNFLDSAAYCEVEGTYENCRLLEAMFSTNHGTLLGTVFLDFFYYY
jgi:hypothetical protein